MSYIGTLIMFSGYLNDSNSTFISNRKVTGGGACYLISFAQAYFYSTKFIYNYASIMGGAIGITQSCFVYMYRSYVIGCSSDKGGIFLITERASIYIIDSDFYNNSANSGGVVHAMENYGSSIIFQLSRFGGNKGGDNLFNLMNSHLIMEGILMYDNQNTIFSLTQSSISLAYANISDHSCSNYMLGCVINSIQASSISCSYIRIVNIKNLKEEGNIYIEESSGIFEYIYFENLDNEKNIGNCFDLSNSNISINNASFITFSYNCIYAQTSRITINNSFFDNKAEDFSFIKKINDNSLHYGAIYCFSCLGFNLSNSILQYNTLSSFGGGITLLSPYSDDINLTIVLNNDSFIENTAQRQGGSVYISNVNGEVIGCMFKNNNADFGAGIYFESLCIKYI